MNSFICTNDLDALYRRILLSTFRDIEWNAPFYTKLGFQSLAEVELTSGFQQIRRKEAEAGLPIDKRVIMYRELQQPNNRP